MTVKKLFLLFPAAALALGAAAQNSGIENANTIKVQPLKGTDDLKNKAVHVVPTKNQLQALQDGYIAFIHFGPNTFTRREWGTGMEDPRVFDLKTLDTDQWVRAMKDAGMTKVIFTAKHHDGFVLWQSRYTDHGIMSSGFRDGKGDVLADLAKSCRKYGLKLGIYLSPADLYQIENPEGLYGNLSKKTTRTIPRKVEGRPFANKTTFTFDGIDDYNEYFLNQLFELLTEYGEIDEVWFDGAHPKRKGGQTYNYAAWKELIHKLAPNAVVFGREDIRWCGNEAGGTRPTEWNVVAYDVNPDTATVFHDMTDADLGSLGVLAKAQYMHYQPAETNTSIREGWFYRDDDNQRSRSANDVFDMYERAVGGNSIFLLNIPPNREGRFSQVDVDVLAEAGKRIRETYTTNLLKGSNLPAALTDGEITTFIEAAGPVEIVLPKAVTMNRFMIQEPVSERGERIESLRLEAMAGGRWVTVAECTNVGFKRILRFADVTTDRLRVTVTGSRAVPYIAEVSAHFYAARPPQLEAIRSLDGMVTLAPVRSDFGWNNYGENASSNLSAGMKIHYTLDGSRPTAASAVYEAPFMLDNGTVNAVAILNGEAGPVVNARFGYAKNGWKITADSHTDKHEAAKAVDADPATYWKSASLDKSAVTVDLGSRKKINGFIYTPQKADSEGVISGWQLLVSDNGSKWTKAGEYEFGNLINDPSPREQRLEKAVSGRYVKFVPLATAADSPCATIAELDIF